MPPKLTQTGPLDSHPAFQPRKKRAPWIFKLDAPFQIQTPWTGLSFQADWLELRVDGLLLIPRDYAWDGCSPKRSLLDIAVIGTPDGIIDITTMKPRTYYASLVHDVLYQYYGYHGIARREIDRFFRTLLQKAHFAPAGLYYCMVRLFGGLGFSGRAIVRVENQEFFRDWLAGRE